jgi:hypothetical protein
VEDFGKGLGDPSVFSLGFRDPAHLKFKKLRLFFYTGSYFKQMV